MSLLVRASRQSRVCVNLEIEERNYSKQDQYFCPQVLFFRVILMLFIIYILFYRRTHACGRRRWLPQCMWGLVACLALGAVTYIHPYSTNSPTPTQTNQTEQTQQDGYVCFRNSELLSGNLCKKTLGGQKGGLYYVLLRSVAGFILCAIYVCVGTLYGS